jgi:hypothetical protein
MIVTLIEKDPSIRQSELHISIGDDAECCVGVLENESAYVNFNRSATASTIISLNSPKDAVPLEISLHKSKPVCSGRLNLRELINSALSKNMIESLSDQMSLASPGGRVLALVFFRGTLSVLHSAHPCTKEPRPKKTKKEVGDPIPSPFSSAREAEVRRLGQSVRRILEKQNQVVRPNERLFAEPTYRDIPPPPAPPDKKPQSVPKTIRPNPPRCAHPDCNRKPASKDHYRPLPEYYKPLRRKQPREKKEHHPPFIPPNEPEPEPGPRPESEQPKASEPAERVEFILPDDKQEAPLQQADEEKKAPNVEEGEEEKKAPKVEEKEEEEEEAPKALEERRPPPTAELNIEDIMAEVDDEELDLKPKKKIDVAPTMSQSLGLSESLERTKRSTASLAQEPTTAPVTTGQKGMEGTDNLQMEETPEKGKVDDGGTFSDDSILSLNDTDP